MRKRSLTSVRVVAMLAMALVCNLAMAQQSPDLPLSAQAPARDCVIGSNGERVCKPPAKAQHENGSADTDIPNGGCWLEEGAWMCEPPVR